LKGAGHLLLLPWRTLLEQTLVEQGVHLLKEGCYLIPQCLRDGFDGLKGEATDKDREPPKEPLFPNRE
jgi:hypothetical protein